MTRRVYFLFLILLCVSCSSHGSLSRQDNVCFGKRCMTVEVVQSPEDVMRGLQHRKYLAGNTGMLFIFPKVGTYDFWMKDTLIALDMIWLDENRNVVYIAQDVLPCLKDPCPTYGPAQASRYVLEINAGDARQGHIRVGDRAEFKLRE